MNTYKNISKEDLYVPQVGLVKAGEEVKTEININNSNFQKVVPAKPTQVKTEENKNKIN